MSADNGVYILETEGPEYRVNHLMAVDNISWDAKIGGHTDDQEIWIKNAREMWRGCETYTDRTVALKEADRILQDLPICEYGINFIKVERRF